MQFGKGAALFMNVSCDQLSESLHVSVQESN